MRAVAPLACLHAKKGAAVCFFSQLTNCSSCHLLAAGTVSGREPFTNYRFHNIGIPVNETVRSLNGSEPGFRDRGLVAHPAVDDSAALGKFKVPSLRNVAVTAPYMHNGVFRKLETAIHFYNQFVVDNASTRINPETNAPWGIPEVAATIDRELLSEGQPLDPQRIGALVAFLRTLHRSAVSSIYCRRK